MFHEIWHFSKSTPQIFTFFPRNMLCRMDTLSLCKEKVLVCTSNTNTSTEATYLDFLQQREKLPVRCTITKKHCPYWFTAK